MTNKVKIGLLNYGAGNMASIRNALDFIDIPYVEITKGPLPDSSDYIFILPGVGSFSEASNALRLLKFDDLSLRSVKLIGICLGMQLLFSDSTEGDLSPGLGLIPGNVRPIIDYFSSDVPRLPIPHVGWQPLNFYPDQAPFSLSHFHPHDFYFVHSFMAVEVDPSNIVASVEYGGVSIPAIVANKSVIGLQFHPEKSGLYGLNLIREVIDYLQFL
ncbi:imidazole glycerol phosphate synthase subunit HisH [bacterium]|nr:imidazole glycerol phosphate synthase subunit HisH [bacterium]